MLVFKLDKENVQKLQRQRETLIAQGMSESYPLQNSTSPKLCDAIGQLLSLNEATDVECDMEKENDMKRFVQLLEKSEKIVLQQYIHDIRSDDVMQKLKNAMPTINPSQNCLNWYLFNRYQFKQL